MATAIPTDFTEDSETIGQKIAESYRLTPQSEEELEMAMQNAIRLTEEEPRHD